MRTRSSARIKTKIGFPIVPVTMRYLIALLALAGVVVSALALRVHYVTGTEPCDINAHWDCGIVNHSSFCGDRAMFLWPPSASPDICCWPASVLARWRFAAFLAALAGLLFAFRLSMIEQYGLGVWCLYCAISQGSSRSILLLSLGWCCGRVFAASSAQRARAAE